MSTTIIDSPLESINLVPDALADTAMELLAGRRAFTSPRSNMLIGEVELVVSIGGSASNPVLIVHTPEELSIDQIKKVASRIEETLAEKFITLADSLKCARKAQNLADREETLANLDTLIAEAASAAELATEERLGYDLKQARADHNALKVLADSELAIARRLATEESASLRAEIRALKDRPEPEARVIEVPIEMPVPALLDSPVLKPAATSPSERSNEHLERAKNDFITSGIRPSLDEFGPMLAYIVSLHSPEIPESLAPEYPEVPVLRFGPMPVPTSLAPPSNA